MMKKAYGYLRVSTEEQFESGLGLAAQRERIAAYCKLQGLELAECFEDAGISGGRPLHLRPAGKRLLALVRRKGGIVITARLDRLFRSVADAAQTIADFDRRGVELVALAERFDTTSPYGRAMAQMASVFAELERAMIGERTKAALRVKRLRRERISRHAPFGWDFGPQGTLVQNRQEQKALLWMQELRAAGRSLREIASLLNERGISPKRGGRWLHSSVLRILGRVEFT